MSSQPVSAQRITARTAEIGGTLPVNRGGTGSTTLLANGLLYGEETCDCGSDEGGSCC